MFELDQWQEIFETLKKNKLRSVLTGFSVAWGIYMLVVLLAAGKGFENGVRSNFKDMSPTLIEIGAGQTSLPYKGIKQGRQVEFIDTDINAIKKAIPNISEISAEMNVWGDNYVSYKNKEGSFHVIGCHATYDDIEKNTIMNGRFINQNDDNNQAKVCVIGSNVKDALFKNEDCIGKYITLKGIPFMVIGDFYDQGKPWRQGRIFIPFSTAQLVYNGGKQFQNMLLTLASNAKAEESNQAVAKIKSTLANIHSYDVNDPKAIWVFNFSEMITMVNGLFTGITLFIWIVGIGTIIAGIVGVSNIMIIAVKERTKEIGIRKALGAPPSSIVGLIVKESILLTSLFGYIGLFAAIVTIELGAYAIKNSEVKSETFNNPEIDFKVALLSLLLLVISGTLAGLLPAKKAASVLPIEALRSDH